MPVLYLDTGSSLASTKSTVPPSCAVRGDGDNSIIPGGPGILDVLSNRLWIHLTFQDSALASWFLINYLSGFINCWDFLAPTQTHLGRSMDPVILASGNICLKRASSYLMLIIEFSSQAMEQEFSPTAQIPLTLTAVCMKCPYHRTLYSSH